jgi:type I restriction enzyme M protein
MSSLGKFALGEGKKTVPLELLGLERCIQFLRPGGKLGIVLPDGVLVNRKTDYARQWLAGHAKLRAIVSLPIETFSPFGASIKTSVLFVRKWKSGEKKTEDHNVHMARVDNIGYDATGRKRNSAEIEQVAKAIRTFLNKEGW